MTILLPALAIAIAAFCVWLTVRIVNRRERWVKWTLAGVVGVPVLYVASFGPACWVVDRGWIAPRPIAYAYWPCLRAMWGGIAPHAISEVLYWWATMGNDDSKVVLVLAFSTVDD